jgi:hypothetical protein
MGFSLLPCFLSLADASMHTASLLCSMPCRILSCGWYFISAHQLELLSLLLLLLLCAADSRV